MEYNQLIAQLTPDIYLRLKTAIETGKWPDGRALTQEQKTSCLEAVLRYQHSGYMSDKCASSSSSVPKSTAEQVIKIH